MKLCQLTTQKEREIFGKCLSEARATHGLGYRDTKRSRLSHAHLAVADLYALYENDDDPVEKMISGFRLNDLATLPQSLPRPDMSHLPPSSVLEGGELWSLSKGAGRIASCAVGGMVGLRQAKAVLIQAVAKPMDLTGFWHQQHFVDACEPVVWPFAETLDGGELWVQPMTLEGERLALWVREGFDLFFRTHNTDCLLRFASQKPLKASPEKTERERPSDFLESRTPFATKTREETNGAVHN
jgi:hypothetical protein